ncbi:putative OsmC-like protein [Salsuginibacillus halophilus]|uniref:Putative OsmC-like protein n=1 Tax=Salsuginibacillus halophilus TaxID=517424 RepID=A0A2P8HDV9_9BACI|nr:OsmC family protein [Salsuginibacillus halophilus]PSL44406.1 putative OsmC-like protein [Salsuginibacillus halophilus]
MAQKMTFQAKGSSQNMQTTVTTGNHQVTIDEPPNMGGEDTGPDPLGNLLASLAGCENVIANMVAKEIDFELNGITFDVTAELDPRGLMGQADVRPYFQKAHVHAKVHTSEPQERIDELQQKTDARCPVYTTLEAAGVELTHTWEPAEL